MSIKKRLGLGAMSAVMGLSLIGTGTWAAFNDVEKVSATVGAGELNLALGKYQDKSYKFLLSNLKPGDNMTREVVLKNDGSLAIKDVLMAIELVNFTDYVPSEGEPGYSAGARANGEKAALSYLDQFKVSVVKVGSEGGGIYPLDIIGADKNVTLKDFYLASDSVNGGGKHGATPADIATARSKVAGSVNSAYIEGNRINVATVSADKWSGLPLIPKDDDRVKIKIEFVDNTTDMTNGLYDQNIYQGDKADIKVSFEARQWQGQEVTDEDMNGTDVETNRKANNGDSF